MLTSKSSLTLFKSMNVMSSVEMEARKKVELETYVLNVQIEGRIFTELVYNHILPSAISYQNSLIANVNGLKEIYATGFKEKAKAQLQIIEHLSEHITELKKKTDVMVEARKLANAITEIDEKAISYCDKVRPYFEEIRFHSDRLERVIDDQVWPLAKNRELLFIK